MQDTFQQQPTPNTPVGYRPLVPAGLTKSAGNAIYAYIAAAAGIGMLVGMGIAIGGTHPNAAAPRVADAISTHTSGLNALQAAYTGPAPSLLSTVDKLEKANSGTPLTSPLTKTTAKKPTEARKRGLHKLLFWKKDSGNQAKRKPYVSPNAPTDAAEPTALELATAAAATGPFVLGMQGDATIASYDVATGAIGTYEGTSFVLDKTNADTSAIAWQDFPFNVHYSCENNSCTIFRHGATATARLTR